MKTLKTLAIAALAFASAQALAWTPPYHISGTTILGTATFKSSGGCKVPSKKFVNAQFGSIQDSTNASVGQGVISADGAAILAVSNSTPAPMYAKLFQDTNPPGKVELKYIYNFINADVLGYIAAESGCVPGGVWTAPNSYFEQKTKNGIGGPGTILNLTIKQSFTGYLAANVGTTCDNTSKPGVLTCNLKKFSGGMSFKGQYIVP